jgi:hypothetical protein
VGRDGWRARAAFPAFGAPAPRDGLPWEPWLSAPGGAVLVRAAPGRVEVALDELVLEPGDPALFAVSWAELFDRALLPHPGVVALADRAAAGPPSQRAPLLPAAPAGSGLARAALDAWLAGLCALCALLAAGLARR